MLSFYLCDDLISLLQKLTITCTYYRYGLMGYQNVQQKSFISTSSSITSYHSTASSKGDDYQAKGQQDEGVEALSAGDYSRAVLLFIQAVKIYDKQKGGGEKKQARQQALATLYGYRCEALYELGAYEASVRDARNALECEGMSRSSVGGLNQETGVVLRAKVLCSLGFSLLSSGHVVGVARAFEESMSLANSALGDADDDDAKSESKTSYAHYHAVGSLQDTVKKATEGQSNLGKYEALRTKLENVKYNKDYLDNLDGALAIAPDATEWHIAKVKHLVKRQRWFVVANHCEQVAAKASKFEGVFIGDLAEVDPFPGIPSNQQLDADFFVKVSLDGEPYHLRKLTTKAVRDAVFRLPKELLPYYLRSLRLEERYSAAVLAGTALSEFDSKEKKKGRDNFAENKRFDEEWDKLDRTIKVKEEGDSLFRDGYYDRAVTLYGECLGIDGDDDDGRGSILKPASSYAVACTKANSAGGKLHAVLHSNRAACFTSMGRFEDAIKESSHAIEIHSMYTKAILRRARCYVKIGQKERAQADFDRFITLSQGARDFPYPPPNQGAACYFDMPADVSLQQLDGVKMEMNDLGMKPGKNKKKMQTQSRSRSPPKRASRMSYFSCCKKKDIESQVVTQRNQPNQPSNWPTAGNDAARSGGSEREAQPKRRVSFTSSTQTTRAQSPSLPERRAPAQDPPNDFNNPAMIKARPAFDHPLDATSVADPNIDYYAVLGLIPTASNSDIKKAYHKLVRDCHPDRNSSKEAEQQFDEIKMAYSVLGDTKGKKREYDKARPRIDP